ncbi:MAG: hypothetical protein IPI23_14230 [Bacteroidetes bacterium]|nr:hypothetical protein [Bacteroidota bacterium]
MKNTDNKDQDEIQILFSNTGKTFPTDFTISDFIRKGSKFGTNSGAGYGGWYINEIIKKFNGAFDIIDETGSEGLPNTDLAKFEINFPIIKLKKMNSYKVIWFDDEHLALNIIREKAFLKQY